MGTISINWLNKGNQHWRGDSTCRSCGTNGPNPISVCSGIEQPDPKVPPCKWLFSHCTLAAGRFLGELGNWIQCVCRKRNQFPGSFHPRSGRSAEKQRKALSHQGRTWTVQRVLGISFKNTSILLFHCDTFRVVNVCQKREAEISKQTQHYREKSFTNISPLLSFSLNCFRVFFYLRQENDFPSLHKHSPYVPEEKLILAIWLSLFCCKPNSSGGSQQSWSYLSFSQPCSRISCLYLYYTLRY